MNEADAPIDLSWVVTLSQLSGEHLTEAEGCPTSVVHKGPFSDESDDE